MKQNLRMIVEVLTKIDSNPDNSLEYCSSLNRQTFVKPPTNLKWDLLLDVIHQIEHALLNSQDCNYVDKHAKETLVIIEQKYQHNQQHCWRAHEHHFHSNLQDYVNCPVTCLWEITEFMQKLEREAYNG